jgi:hypothetical protein
MDMVASRAQRPLPSLLLLLLLLSCCCLSCWLLLPCVNQNRVRCPVSERGPTLLCCAPPLCCYYLLLDSRVACCCCWVQSTRRDLCPTHVLGGAPLNRVAS